MALQHFSQWSLPRYDHWQGYLKAKSVVLAKVVVGLNLVPSLEYTLQPTSFSPFYYRCFPHVRVFTRSRNLA